MCDKWCFVRAALPAPSVPTGAAQLVSSFWMGQAAMACSASGIQLSFSMTLRRPLSLTYQGAACSAFIAWEFAASKSAERCWC